jgi:glycosyltransferase involved in cell wall biosynthesis
MGRLEKLKGGSMLIDATVAAASKLRRQLTLTFVGDGTERGSLEEKARNLSADHRVRVDISFTGWLEGNGLWSAVDEADLLAIPSLWPEPFGMVGVEAAFRGVPAVAFDVGGISEWLEDDVNGILLRSESPNASDLAAALTHVLGDSRKHARLCHGAHDLAFRFDPEKHSEKLMTVLNEASRQR